MIAAKEVGGDFYDFFPVDDARIGIVVGDVSGKGVPAALLMAICRTLIRGSALKGGQPHDCISAVNNAISSDVVPGMFVTVFYGVLNTKEGTLEYCCAGHFPPYVVSDQGVRMLESVGGLVVGAVPGWEYQSGAAQLAPGEERRRRRLWRGQAGSVPRRSAHHQGGRDCRPRDHRGPGVFKRRTAGR
jgi:sigma-B regulation protein RsbU (phosphoserine phosphatase)